MKYYHTDDGNVIVLENGENIAITSDKENYIFVNNGSGKGFDIVGDVDLINVVSTKSDNRYIKQSNNKYIKYCDEWLKVYRNVYDVFDSILFTNRAINQNLSLVLDVENFMDIDKFTEFFRIKLSIKRFDETVIDGVQISICSDDISILNYLVSSVVDHYLQKNYNSDEKISENYHVLTGNITNRDYHSASRAIANLSLLEASEQLDKSIKSIIVSRNLGLDTTPFLEGLRSNIHSTTDIYELKRYLKKTEDDYQKILLMKKGK